MTDNNDSPVPGDVRELIEGAGGTIDQGSFMALPDGSGSLTASFPLPKDHWLYQPTGEPPAPWRMAECVRRDDVAARISEAARYAIKAATMSGQEMDFDPDALVQNFIIGMLGYWTPR